MGYQPPPGAAASGEWLAAAAAWLQSAVSSERAAWAAQNAVGALFAAIFVVVLDLQFTLACLCGVLFSASSLVLSLDRSIGGRLFGGVVFIGTVLTGAAVGGALVALAWLARGEGHALVDYLPEAFQSVPNLPTIARMQQALASLAAVPLPQWLQDAVDFAIDSLSELLGALLPPVSGGYWGTLMGLTAAVMLPLAAARADPDFAKGAIPMIATVFVSSMFVFGILTPSIGMHLFWTEVVLGYFKIACVAAAANLVSGTLICVRSAHDDLRRGCAALLRAQGICISRLGTAAAAAAGSCGLPAAAPATAAGEPKERGTLATAPGADTSAADREAERCLSDIRAFVNARVAACAAAAGVDSAISSQSGGSAEQAHGAGLQPLPASASDAELGVVWDALEMSLKTAKLEPPVRHLVCSQAGSNPNHYAALKDRVAALQQATAVLGRGQAACLQALASPAGGDITAPAAAQLRAALVQATALAAAACAGAAEALGHMPALGPCSGAALPWRPLTRGAWAEVRQALTRAAQGLAAGYEEAFKQHGLAFGLSLGIQENRALLFAVAEAAELLECAQAAEAAAAVALGVPGEGSVGAGSPGQAASKLDGCAQDAPADLEDGKLQKGDAAGTAGAPAAGAAAAPRPSTLRRLAANPYVAAFVFLLLLASPLPLAAMVAAACWRAAKALPALARSRAERRAAVRNPLLQYALKYWLVMTGTVCIILALAWKAIPAGPGPIQDAADQLRFFGTWQPIYASITVAICLQDTVEASLFRGVLRSTMTVVGGTLGYLIMLNGPLAQSPYWVCAWTAAGSWMAGLLAPDRTLRYSLFLFVFAYNAVILCQYYGCCDTPGDPLIYAGKVVSTVIGSTIALMGGWLVLPWYGSTRMLADQAAALRAAAALPRRMWAEVAAAAEGRRAVRTAGWLEQLESDVQVPLARVAADLQLNTLDRRQMPLTWHLLPDPAVLRMVQCAAAALQDRLASAVLVLQRDLFSSPAAVSTPGLQQPARVVPGPVFRSVLPRLRAETEALLDAVDALVEACTANMTTAAAGSGLAPQHASVEEAVATAEAARVQLHCAYVRQHAGTLEAAGGHSAGDFECQAWLHAVLLAVDEVLAVGRLLLLEPAQDRDVLLGWLRAWRGQRAPPT